MRKNKASDEVRSMELADQAIFPVCVRLIHALRKTLRRFHARFDPSPQCCISLLFVRHVVSAKLSSRALLRLGGLASPPLHLCRLVNTLYKATYSFNKTNSAACPAALSHMCAVPCGPNVAPYGTSHDI